MKSLTFTLKITFDEEIELPVPVAEQQVVDNINDALYSQVMSGVGLAPEGNSTDHWLITRNKKKWKFDWNGEKIII